MVGKLHPSVWEYLYKIAMIRNSDYPDEIKDNMVKKVIEDKLHEIHSTACTNKQEKQPTNIN